MPKEKSPIIDTIRKVCPAVVSIVMSANLPKIKESPFFPFGSHGPGWMIPEQEGTAKVKVGGGSGFFVSANGLVMTNRHVIAETEAEYMIVTNDDQEYPVEILAKDQINDIAILRIITAPKKKFTFLDLGDSRELQLGQTVIAVGNVLGQFSNTVSTGIISGLSRFISAATNSSGQTQQLRGLIQTDAAVNPGNSGGPLVNIFGQVIGINTAVVLGAQNIGFAIPINNAKKDLNDYKKFGKIRSPFFGVRHMILNEELQRMFNLPVGYGALVIREPIPGDHAVIPDSPADRAHIQERDIILKIDSKKIDEKTSLQDIVQDCKIGEEVEIEILRNGKIEIVKTKVGER